MALEDDLKSRTSGLVSQQMANWVVVIQRAIQGHQAALVRALDELGEDVARYDEKIDEAQIGAAIAEVLQQSGGVGGGSGGEGGGGADYSALKTSIAAIEQGSNLSEVLTHLVNEVTKFVERGAMFIVKAQNAVGWYGAGVDNPEILKTISIPMTADTVFKIANSSRRAEKGHISQSPETAQALARLGGGAGGYLVVPLILRDKVAAILYCDTLAPEVPAVKADAIEILVAFAEKVIDVLSSARTGNTSPGLRSQPPTSAPPAPAPQVANEGPQTVMFGTGTIKPQQQQPPPVVSPPPTPPAPAPRPAAARAPAPAAPPVRAMTPEQQKAHDDARRFARLVVSEIKLYNEAKVAEGRKTKDIYERLKEDVERGRQMYNDRVAADIRDATDYFQDELVRILGGGDASALGAQ